MFKTEQLKDDLKAKTGLAYIQRNELITLCPKCEQDRFFQNRNHGHLYISVEAPIFKCFRCSFKGIIHKLLREFELNISDYYDSDVFNFDWLKTDTDKFINDTNVEFKIPNISYDDNYDEKLKYLQSRVIDFNIESNENIIFNILDFLNINNIELDKTDEFKEYLNKNFIGFMGTRSSLLICRNIDSNSKFRYFKINLRDIYFKDFYSKKLNSNNNKIILCEGTFDLLNITKHNSTKNIINDSCIIATALNNDFKNTLISVLDYVKMVYADVIIFSDRDMDESVYMPIYFNNCVKSLTLYYNELHKDFGTFDINPIKVPIRKYIKRNN